jgi:acyl carrier protein
MRRPVLSVLLLVLTIAGVAYLASTGFRFWLKLGWFGRIVMCVLLAGSIGGSWAYDRRQKQRVRQHLAGRERLTHEQFGRQFFPPERSQIAAKVRELLATHVFADASQVQPADRLEDDLRMWSLDSMADVELILNLEREFGITFSKDDTHYFRSVADVVNCVAKKMAGREIGHESHEGRE